MGHPKKKDVQSVSVDRKRSQRTALSKAREYIRQNCIRNITLQELCTLTGLSRYYLVRAFAREYGLPPHAYQIHVQIERARQMLDAGILPAIVAAETGFSDQSHFTRHFKKIHGVTPRRYAGPRRPKPKGQ